MLVVWRGEAGAKGLVPELHVIPLQYQPRKRVVVPGHRGRPDKAVRSRFKPGCLAPLQAAVLESCYGFTIIELLIVIGIISILGALLSSTLVPARRKTQSTVCQNNLQQIGVALQMYLHDAEVYPYTLSFPHNNARGASCWFDALSLPLSNAKWGDGIFKCPVYEGIAYAGETTLNRRGELMAVYAPCGSYAYNAAGRRAPAAGPRGLTSAGLGHSIYRGQAVDQPVREGDIRAPADLYAVGDSPLATAAWGLVPQPRTGGAADYNSFNTDQPAIPKARHAGGFNMLLTDGHVENVRTNLLLGREETQLRRWNHDHLP